MRDFFVPSKRRIERVSRLEVVPRHFDETARFWRRLGFQVTITGEVGARQANLRAGDLHVVFHEAQEDPEADRRRNPFDRLRIVISVRAFDEYLEELSTKGFDGVGVESAAGSARAAELVDPNGIRLLLEESA
jgi:hypothetical protein